MAVAVAEAASSLSVGGLLRFLRERQRLTAKEVSRRARLSPSYVSKVERGECEPSLRVFAAIARALGMTPLEVWFVVMHEGAQAGVVTPPLYALAYPNGECASSRTSVE